MLSSQQNQFRLSKSVFRFNALWWIDPCYLLLLLILPLFVVSSVFGADMMPMFGSYNFIDTRILLIGTLMMCLIAAGAAGGRAFGSATQSARWQHLNRENVDLAMNVLAVLSIVAHLIFIGAVFADPTALLAVLNSEQGAIYAVKDQLTKISGITSFTQMYVLLLPLYGAYASLFGSSPKRLTRNLVMILAMLIFLRAFVALERFVIIEAAVAYFLPLLAFRARLPRGMVAVPLIGFAALFVMFCAGEYTRSWPYYVDQYDSFLEFVSLRLLAYIAVATNTSAGVYTVFGVIGFPYLTAGFFWKLPFVTGGASVVTLDAFFQSYGNAEYNNPGGVIAGVIDFGLVGGSIYYLAIGFVAGWLYAKFRLRYAIGIVGYPAFYIGLLLLTQAIYWGNARFFTVAAVFPILVYFITLPLRSPRAVEITV